MDEGTREAEPHLEAEPTIEVRRHWAIGDNEFSEILGKYHWTKTSQYWEFVPRPGAEFTVPDLLAIIKAEPPFEPNPIKTITVGSAAEESSEKAGSLDPVRRTHLRLALGMVSPLTYGKDGPTCTYCGATLASGGDPVVDSAELFEVARHASDCRWRLAMEAAGLIRYTRV